MPTPPDTEWITPGEAARILAANTTTVARWADAGALGLIEYTDGGQRRYRTADVVKLAHQRAM